MTSQPQQSERKYTLGPWLVKRLSNNKRFVVVTEDDWGICDVGGPASQIPANANLIAAAPELLEALQQLLDNAGYVLPTDRAVAEKAIAKAVS